MPLNLKELFGREYKIEIDESANCPGESKSDPWYYRVACKYGHIYPYSDKRLGFYCESGNIRNRLRQEHPEIDVFNWSDDGGAVFLFPVGLFKLISGYAKPRQKRRLSQEHRRRLELAGQRYKFKPLKHGSESVKSTQISTKGVGVVIGGRWSGQRNALGDSKS